MDSLAINLALVNAIKEYPCLYDNNLPAYSKKEITDKAWNEISNEIGIPAGECKEKWKNLRWGFIRSLRPNPDGSVKKKYYLHEQMEFVLPFIKLLPKTGSYIPPNVPSDTDDTDEENIQLLGSEFLEYDALQENPNKRARNELATEKTEIVKNGQSPQFFEYDALPEPHKKRIKVHESVTKQATDSHSRRLFLLSLVPEVNRLTEKQMRAFRRKVFQLIDVIVEDTPKPDANISEEQTQDTTPSIHVDTIKTEILDCYYLFFLSF